MGCKNCGDGIGVKGLNGFCGNCKSLMITPPQRPVQRTNLRQILTVPPPPTVPLVQTVDRIPLSDVPDLPVDPRASDVSKLFGKIRSVAGSANNAVKTVSVIGKVPPTGNFRWTVVGESHYVKEIDKLVGRRGGEKMMTARLIPERRNKHDKNAVRVEVKGKTVGYVPRGDAAKWKALAKESKRRGGRLQVECRVWSGNLSNGEKSGSVTLDAPSDLRLALPVNSVPLKSGCELLPSGKSLKKVSTVGFESNVSSVANSDLFRSGNRAVVLEVVAADGDNKVGIAFEGVTVGKLSPAASKNISPLVNAAKERGVRLFSPGVFEGNSLASEFRVNVCSAKDLSSEETSRLLHQ